MIVVLAVGLMDSTFFLPDVILYLAHFPPSSSLRPHARGSLSSIQRATVSTPCLLPLVSRIPLFCRGLHDTDRQACTGAIGLFLDMQLLPKRLVHYIQPPANFIGTIVALSDTVEHLVQWTSDVTPPCGVGVTAANAVDLLAALERSVLAVGDVITHMQMAVARYVVIEKHMPHT